MTKNLGNQLDFYQDTLNLDLFFNRKDTIGLGKNQQLIIILQKEPSENSHHLSNNSENKGHGILTFKCEGDLDAYAEQIKKNGFKIRGTLKLPEKNIDYLFVEDYDGNEICLDFSKYPTSTH